MGIRKHNKGMKMDGLYRAVWKGGAAFYSVGIAFIVSFELPGRHQKVMDRAKPIFNELKKGTSNIERGITEKLTKQTYESEERMIEGRMKIESSRGGQSVEGVKMKKRK